MKKCIWGIVLILCLCCSVSVFAYEGDIKIFINGNELKVSERPIVVNRVTLVPMRNIFEALGLTVEWDGETQTVIGTGNQTTIKLTVGNKIAYVNQAKKELLVAPRIINGTTMVPIRFISESIGCEVVWNAETRIIEIYSKNDTGQLYVIPGVGSYEGYMLLRGYEDEDKFRVYFQGDANSFMTTVEDLRGINLDEIVTWEYGGITYNSSIKDLYGLFADSLRLKSLLDIAPGEELSDEWFINIFGDVYLDWVTGMEYSSEAHVLVTEYFKQTGQLNTDRNTLLTPDVDVVIETPDNEEKQKEEEVQKRINELLETGESVAH